jgi:catalase
MANTVKDTVVTRRVAILASDGVDTESLKAVRDALTEAGAAGKIVAPRLGVLTGTDGDDLPIDFSLLTASSVLFDAVYVPGGTESVAALAAERDANEFLTEAYRHCKAIAAAGEGVDLVRAIPGIAIEERPSRKGGNGNGSDARGIVIADEATPDLVRRFLEAIAQHRFWARSGKNRLGPAAADETRGRAIPERSDKGKGPRPPLPGGKNRRLPARADR